MRVVFCLYASYSRLKSVNCSKTTLTTAGATRSVGRNSISRSWSVTACRSSAKGFKGTLIVTTDEQWRHRNYRYIQLVYAVQFDMYYHVYLDALVYVREVQYVHSIENPRRILHVAAAYTYKCVRMYVMHTCVHESPECRLVNEHVHASGCDSRDVRRVLAHLCYSQEKQSACFFIFFCIFFLLSAFSLPSLNILE